MKNLFISNLDKKGVNHFTSDLGLLLRKKADKPFKKLVQIFMNANVVRVGNDTDLSDEEYFSHLDLETIPRSSYPLSKRKNINNIIVERYPTLDREESYIFVGNHTCPEDIETMLSVLDRNAYLILGSVEFVKYDPKAYLVWLNGTIAFDILNQKERTDMFPKMERVLKTNSILIFPEGSHNYHPNKLINDLFDGPVNLALRTGKKIVPVILFRDEADGIYYIDVGNPIDVRALSLNVNNYYVREAGSEKYRIKALSSYLRDKMATAVYHLMARHSEPVRRSNYGDMGKECVAAYVEETFKKLKWRHDVFDAEYITKKTKADREYEEVVRTLSCLRLREKVLKQAGLCSREYVLNEMELDSKDVVANLRNHFMILHDS